MVNKIFIIRQIVENAIRFNKTVKMCLMDPRKPFRQSKTYKLVSSHCDQETKNNYGAIIKKLETNNSKFVIAENQLRKYICKQKLDRNTVSVPCGDR